MSMRAKKVVAVATLVGALCGVTAAWSIAPLSASAGCQCTISDGGGYRCQNPFTCGAGTYKCTVVCAD